ncbi:MAG: HEAT repeat domain-containing protein [Elusimicrobia bacterium]|nr:HEAT repeat domain-containing protein [Elusimicrobiota bacterium]
MPSSFWASFVMDVTHAQGPNFLQLLKLDLSNPSIPESFFAVMGKTNLFPSEVKGKPVKVQAKLIQDAVGAYAKSVFRKVDKIMATAAKKSDIKIGQASDPDSYQFGAASTMWELYQLKAILGAVPEAQRDQVKMYQASLQAHFVSQLKDVAHKSNLVPDESGVNFDSTQGEPLHPKMHNKLVNPDLETVEFAGKKFPKVQFPPLPYLEEPAWGHAPKKFVESGAEVKIFSAGNAGPSFTKPLVNFYASGKQNFEDIIPHEVGHKILDYSSLHGPPSRKVINAIKAFFGKSRGDPKPGPPATSHVAELALTYGIGLPMSGTSMVPPVIGPFGPHGKITSKYNLYYKFLGAIFWLSNLFLFIVFVLDIPTEIHSFFSTKYWWLGPAKLGASMGWLVRHEVPVWGPLAAKWLAKKFSVTPMYAIKFSFPLQSGTMDNLDKAIRASCVKALKSPYPEIANLGSDILSRYGPISLDEIVPLLENESQLHVHANAIMALARNRHLPQNIISLLLIALQDQDVVVRRHASIVLAHQDNKEHPVKEALYKALEDKDLAVRVQASLGLLHDAYPFFKTKVRDLTLAAVRDLIAYWEQADESTKTGILHVLEQDDSLPAFAVDGLVEILKDKKDYKYRGTVFKVLIGQKILPDPILKELLSLFSLADLDYREVSVWALKHPDQNLSEAAARNLAARDKIPLSDGKKIEDGIVEAFSHPAAYVRRNAVKALATTNEVSDSALIVLGDLLKDPDVTVRRSVVQAIQRNSSNKTFGGYQLDALFHPEGGHGIAIRPLGAHVLNQVQEASKDEDPEVRLGATFILSGQGVTLSQEAQNELLSALKYHDATIRQYAADAFAQLPSLTEPLLGYLSEALRDPEEDVRHAAINALAKSSSPSQEQYEILAKALWNSDEYVRMTAYGALQKHKDLIPSIFPLLTQALRSPDEFIGKCSYGLLRMPGTLPEFVHQALLDTFKEGNPEFGWLRSGKLFLNMKSPPAFVRDGLVEIFKNTSDQQKRKHLVEILQNWLSASELLSLLYPEQVVGELTQLIPDLQEMKAQNFTSSPLADPVSLADLMDYLRELNQSLSPEEYRQFVSTFENLKSIKMKVLMTPGYSDFMEGGYHMPYTIFDLNAKKIDHPAVFASVNPGGASPNKELLIKTFEAFDKLIDTNFQALEIMARSAGSMDKATAKVLLEHAARMVASYQLIAGEKNEKLESKFNEISKELEFLWSGLQDRAPLPKEVARRVTELEPNQNSLSGIRNLHTLINYIHQKSFTALTRVTGTAKADGSMQIGGRGISFTNLSTERLVEKGRLANPLLRLLATRNIPSGRAILKDDQLWYHAKLGQHSVEVHIKLAEPDEGGLLQVRYSEGGHDNGNQLRLVYVAEVLKLLGAPVETQGNQFLNSSWDKDHGLLSRSQLEKALPRFLSALTQTGNLDWALQRIEIDEGFDRAREVARAMAATHIAQGKVPFFVHVNSTHSNALHDSYVKYLDVEKSRVGYRDTLNRELHRLGLPEIPKGLPFGQEVIDEQFTLPVRLALARGELVLDSSGIPQQTDYRPIERLAQAISGDHEAPISMAAALSASEMNGVNIETIGGIGRLRAERAQWFWGDKDGVVAYTLLDPQTQTVAYATAYHWDGQALQNLDADALVEILRRRGIESSLGTLSSRIQRRKWHRLSSLAPLPAESGTTAQGLAASSGPGSFVTGRAVFRKEGGIKKGGVFIAPYTTPDDLEYMRQSAAVVTTGGGLLSHAAITTRELGLPAVILNDAHWASLGGQSVLEIEVEHPGEAVQGPGDLWLVREVQRKRLQIKEGDIIRVDGRRGLVTSFNLEAQGNISDSHFNQTIEEIYRTLREFRGERGMAATIAAWLGHLRGPPQFIAARFVLEEALWNPILANYRDEIVAAALSVNQELRRELQSYGKELLRTRLAQIEQEIEPDQDVSESDIVKLKTQLSELTALSEALQIDRSPLQVLEATLEEWQSLSQTVKRRAAEAIETAVQSWTQRIHDLQTADLPGLRSIIRHLSATHLEQDLALMQAKANELATEKKERILRERPSVIPLENVDDDFSDLVGGKSAKLGEIMQVVLREGGYVPQGVALTTEAYLRFLSESGLEDQVMREAQEMDEYLSHADLNRQETLEWIRDRSARIQDLIRSARLDSEQGLGREILDSLKGRRLEGALFAVRSSAVQEDRQEAAFAGAAETYLYVDLDNILEKVVENWASFWLPRGIQYRWQQGIRSIELRPAVTIQKMANAEAAGVMFTINPVTGRRDIVINAAFGLGEGIVSGLVQADQYLANREGEEIAPPVLGNKKVKVVRKIEGVGTEVRPVPPKERKRRTLTPTQVRQLTLIGTALEDYFGYPLDIEFAIEDGQIVILQARPVTVSGINASRQPN